MRPFTLLLALAIPGPAPADSPLPRCTPAGFGSVEARLQASDAWCQLVDARWAAAAVAPVDPGSGPAFDCGKVRAGSIESRICADPALAALDRRLAGVYRRALDRAAGERPPSLKAEQRGWIKGRNDCWKAEDPAACVTDSYRRRIAELQARYRMVRSTGPFGYQCGEGPADEIVVTYFETDPPTLEAERGDSVSLMFLQPGGSGARYQGGNESFWEHHGEARVQWGFGAEEMTCRLRP